MCPKCGHKVPHVAGQRCMDVTCPECGTRMVRE
jgi:DNA-directed RNA polymerase subunit RPC12/RpoP